MLSEWGLDAGLLAGNARTWRGERAGLLSGEITRTSGAELHQVRVRSEHIIANNGYAATAKFRYQANVVGTGFKVQFRNAKTQAAWQQFEEMPTYRKGLSLNALINSLAGDFFSSGEFFLRVLAEPAMEGLTKVQWIPPRLCDLFLTDSLQDLWQGVSLGKFNEPIKYWFKRDWVQNGGHQAVSAQEILHGYNQTSADQLRGIPIIAPALLSLYELDEVVDATVIRQKAAQAVGWVVEHADPMSMPALGQVMEDTKGKPLQEIRAGGIHYLRKGEKVTFPTIPDIGASFNALLQEQLYTIATTCLTTHAELTGNLGAVNFSSARVGLIAVRRVLEQHQQFHLMQQLLMPLVKVFMARVMEKELPVITPPKWVWVDQLGETKSDILEIEAGLKTLEIALAERGLTLEQFMESKARSAAAEALVKVNSDSKKGKSNGIK